MTQSKTRRIQRQNLRYRKDSRYRYRRYANEAVQINPPRDADILSAYYRRLAQDALQANRPDYFDPARLGRIRSKKGGFYRRTTRREEITPLLAAAPLADDRRPVIVAMPDRDIAPFLYGPVAPDYVELRKKGTSLQIKHPHPHSNPSHHVGPCDPACRAGATTHAHRIRRQHRKR